MYLGVNNIGFGVCFVIVCFGGRKLIGLMVRIVFMSGFFRGEVGFFNMMYLYYKGWGEGYYFRRKEGRYYGREEDKN